MHVCTRAGALSRSHKTYICNIYVHKYVCKTYVHIHIDVMYVRSLQSTLQSPQVAHTLNVCITCTYARNVLVYIYYIVPVLQQVI
jgi:hypothetical protein